MAKHVLIIFLLVVSLLAGCTPAYTPVSDPAAADLSAYQAGKVSGEGFKIAPDVRIFTLYALLNGVGGYDAEHGEQMTPARQALRADLAERLAGVPESDVARWRKFIDDHGLNTYAYLMYTLALGAPPEFPPVLAESAITEMGIMRRYHGLEQVLGEFYAATALEELYLNDYQERMADEVGLYDPQRIAGQIEAMYGYLRIADEDRPEVQVTILPNPYESHYMAYAIIYAGQLNIVEGAGSNDYGLNVHEHLHLLVNPVVEAQIKGLESKFKPLMEANREAAYVAGSYEDTVTYVYECLVRAVDYRIALHLAGDSLATEARLQRIMADETRGGLVLVEPFYAALAAYENDPRMTFEAFVAQALAEIEFK